MAFPKEVKDAITSYEDIGRQYGKEKEYALTTWKTCPKCKEQRMCALTPKSELYQCPKCGYIGKWLDYPSGFGEYRKGMPMADSVIWPIATP